MGCAETCSNLLGQASLWPGKARQHTPGVTSSVEADPRPSRAQFVGMSGLDGDPRRAQHRNDREQRTMLDSVPAAILVILEVED